MTQGKRLLLIAGITAALCAVSVALWRRDAALAYHSRSANYHKRAMDLAARSNDMSAVSSHAGAYKQSLLKLYNLGGLSAASIAAKAGVDPISVLTKDGLILSHRAVYDSSRSFAEVVYRSENAELIKSILASNGFSFSEIDQGEISELLQ